MAGTDTPGRIRFFYRVITTSKTLQLPAHAREEFNTPGGRLILDGRKLVLRYDRAHQSGLELQDPFYSVRRDGHVELKIARWF